MIVVVNKAESEYQIICERWLNACVNPKMSEMMLAKSRKEEEIASLKERLKATQGIADFVRDAFKELETKTRN